MSRNKIDLNLLLVLEVLLEESSVTKAARRLGVTQPALTQSLKKLRLMFDDPLLIRRENQMYPTALALSLLHPLEELMTKADDILNLSTSFDPAECSLEFRMFLEDTGQSVMAPLLYRELKRQAPKARLRLIREGSQEDFQNGNVDVMFWHRRWDEPFCFNPVYESKFVTIARKGHPICGMKTLTLEEFAQVPQITMEGAGNFMVDIDDEINRQMDASGLKRNIAVAMSSLLAVKRLVGSSDLIATVPEVLLNIYEADIEIRLVKSPIKIKPVPIYQIWHQRTDSHPAHRWFRQFITSVYRQALQPIPVETNDL